MIVAGICLRKSVEKNDASFEFVPVNLHLQAFTIFEGSDKNCREVIAFPLINFSLKDKICHNAY